MKVIGVAGQLNSGKDVVSDYLASRLNKRSKSVWRRIGFAHAVKKVYMDTFNVTWDFIEEWKRKDEIPPGFNMNVRKSLQFIGDGFRQIQNDIWIQTAFREDVPKIISDCRYINELTAVHEHGGLNVLIWRPGYENNDPNPSESQIRPLVDCFAGKKKYVDPMWLSLVDCFIVNEGTLEELYRKVDDQLVPLIEEKYDRDERNCR